MILTGGGDCPGLNAVIRSIVRCASYDDEEWEIFGSKRAYNGILQDPQNIVKLNVRSVSGIHVRGGTILETVNKGDPFDYPIKNKKGDWVLKDCSNDLIKRLKALKIDAIISIGGDGSQRISQQLYEKGVNIIGVPKTIDNDLYATDLTFGFQTAVEIATDAVDKLVTTAQSHNRVMIAEVMGRDAGWICLHAAVAAGAEIALIPEIPYDIDKVIARIDQRYRKNLGFAIIVISEGAHSKYGQVTAKESNEVGYQNRKLGGVGYTLMEQLKEKKNYDSRVTVLGHIQRGGIPNSFDRILATQFGHKAFELVKSKKYGQMVSYKGSKFTHVSLKTATSKNKFITKSEYLLKTARKMNICLGD